MKKASRQLSSMEEKTLQQIIGMVKTETPRATTGKSNMGSPEKKPRSSKPILSQMTVDSDGWPALLGKETCDADVASENSESPAMKKAAAATSKVFISPHKKPASKILTKTSMKFAKKMSKSKVPEISLVSGKLSPAGNVKARPNSCGKCRFKPGCCPSCLAKRTWGQSPAQISFGSRHAASSLQLSFWGLQPISEVLKFLLLQNQQCSLLVMLHACPCQQAVALSCSGCCGEQIL